MKILLAQVGRNSPDYPIKSHPIGIMALAAWVERELPGASVDLLDMKVSRFDPRGIGRLAAEREADVVGLGCMSVHADMLHETAAAVRAALPNVKLIAGGPHATCFPAEVLKDESFDAVVLGEGEKPFVKLLAALRDCRNFSGITAVGTRERLNPAERDIVPNLDALPLPAWDKLNLDDYTKFLSFGMLGRRRYMTLVTSRGCPYHCIYCHNIFGGRFRPRGAKKVVEEMGLLARIGIKDFEIIDDIFNLKRERVVEICERIIAAGLKVKLAFPNGLRSDLLDEELLRLMKRAGTRYAVFAIETASPRLQKLTKKNLNLDKAAAAIRAAARMGIFTTAFFMVGYPTETEEELRQTVRFALRSPLQGAHFFKVTPFMDTPMFDLLDEKTKDRMKENLASFNYYDRSFNLSEVPNDRFRKIVRDAYTRFYLNPFRVMAIFRRHPNPWGALHYAREAFLRLFVRG